MDMSIPNLPYDLPVKQVQLIRLRVQVAYLYLVPWKDRALRIKSRAVGPEPRSALVRNAVEPPS